MSRDLWLYWIMVFVISLTSWLLHFPTNPRWYFDFWIRQNVLNALSTVWVPARITDGLIVICEEGGYIADSVVKKVKVSNKRQLRCNYELRFCQARLHGSSKPTTWQFHKVAWARQYEPHFCFLLVGFDFFFLFKQPQSMSSCLSDYDNGFWLIDPFVEKTIEYETFV